jgi:hypothetical protein
MDTDRRTEFDGLLTRFPEPVAVYPSRTKLRLVVSAIAAVVAAFFLVFLSPDPRLPKSIFLDPVNWIGFALAAYFIAVPTRLLISHIPLVTLGRQSLTVTRGLHEQEIQWRDVKDIYVDENFLGHRWVCLKYRLPDVRKNPFDTLVRLPRFHRDAIALDDLVHLMLRWRDCSLGQAAK